MSRQIVIVGGPHTGKTTLAERLKNELDIASVKHSTDDLMGLGWSEASEAASRWFSETGDWIIEGVSTARALRKWLTANPGKSLDAEILVLDEAFTPLLKGQQSMTAGVHTVFREIEAELTQRGARILKLKNANDAITLFRQERTEEQRRKDNVMPDDPADKDGKDPATSFQNALAKKNGDALQLASQLFDENFSLRGEKRALKAEAEEIKKRVPAEGSVVLSPDKAKDYDAYKALGKADELKTRLEAHATLETQVAELKQKDVLREVADLHGYKLSVLLDRDKAAGGLKISFKEDKGSKVAHVKDGDKETPITEFAEANWADYLPSLKVEQATQPRAGSGNDPRPKGNSGPSVADIKAQKLRSGHYAI